MNKHKYVVAGPSLAKAEHRITSTNVLSRLRDLITASGRRKAHPRPTFKQRSQLTP
jgi:hypothetical protein